MVSESGKAKINAKAAGSNARSSEGRKRERTLRADLRQFTRQRILDAALDCFRRSHFRTTTIEQIVQAAGMTVPTFYRYFSSKDDLLVPLRDYLQGEVEAVIRTLDQVDHTDRRAVRQWFDSYIVMWSRVHRLCDAFWEGSTLDSGSANQIFPNTISVVDVMDNALARNKQRGTGFRTRMGLAILFMDRAALLVIAADSAREADDIRDEFSAMLWSVLNDIPANE